MTKAMILLLAKERGKVLSQKYKTKEEMEAKVKDFMKNRK